MGPELLIIIASVIFILVGAKLIQKGNHLLINGRREKAVIFKNNFRNSGQDGGMYYPVGNHFVAMEYNWLILNRTLLILLTDDKIIGIKVNGPIGVKSSDPLINLLPLAMDGDLQNPYSYINMKYIEKVKDIDLLSDSILKINKTNFILNRADITKAEYDKRKNGEWDITHMMGRSM